MPDWAKRDGPTEGLGQQHVLEVRNLKISFATESDPVVPVDGVDLSLARGKTVGVVGESGSGKTTLGLSLMGLLPVRGTRVEGEIRLNGQDLRRMSREERQRRMGRDIAMVFQDPGMALNPLTRVGRQVVEAVRAHDRTIGTNAARSRAREMMSDVGLEESQDLMGAFPHELSGGMKQRVMIAMAMVNHPSVLIADEPTTSLDVTVQAQVLRAMMHVQEKYDTGVLFITHNLGVVAELADSVAVMYAGRIIESGRTASVLRDPSHPYTRALLASVPSVGIRRNIESALPGVAAGARDRPSGCRFHPRCRFASDRCADETPTLRVTGEDGRLTACHYAESIESQIQRETGSGGDGGSGCPELAGEPSSYSSDPVVEVDGLRKRYKRRPRWLLGHGLETVAVDDVSLEVLSGQTLGVVGESGSGKTTLARCVVRLIEPDEGSVKLRSREVMRCSKAELAGVRQDIQFVFQDPFESLDPLWSMGDVVAEPLRRSGETADRKRAIVAEALTSVDLSITDAQRRPREFSGGERQRIAIARALVSRPKVILLDEPCSSLDVSVQAKIAALLRRLQHEGGIAYVFITHDLALCRQMADTVAVMYKGQLVEYGDADRVFSNPEHSYTAQLLAAVPEVWADREVASRNPESDLMRE